MKVQKLEESIRVNLYSKLHTSEQDFFTLEFGCYFLKVRYNEKSCFKPLVGKEGLKMKANISFSFGAIKKIDGIIEDSGLNYVNTFSLDRKIDSSAMLPFINIFYEEKPYIKKNAVD